MRESYRLTFALGDMRGGSNLGGQQLEVLLRALVGANVLRLKKDRRTASASRIRFEEYPTGWRPPGEEEWQDAASLLLSGSGGNRDLVCARVAELQVEGIAARAVPEIKGDQWRATVLLPDGTRRAPGPADAGAADSGWRPLRDQERITFVLDLFNGQKGNEDLAHATLDVLLAALTRIDENQLRAHPDLPRLYALGERLLYMEEPIGQEDWQDAITCIRMGFGDCEDFSCWRAAESNVRDRIPARAAFSKHESDGKTLYHITTMFPGNRREDPSRIQGMR